jgi:hypothetical protein
MNELNTEELAQEFFESRGCDIRKIDIVELGSADVGTVEANKLKDEYDRLLIEAGDRVHSIKLGNGWRYYKLDIAGKVQEIMTILWDRYTVTLCRER